MSARLNGDDVSFCEERPLEQVAYTFDGTLEGLFTAIFVSYERHEHPEDVVAANDFAPRIGQSEIFIETNIGKAERVRRGIIRYGDYRAYLAVKRAFVSEDPHAATTIYRFVVYLAATRGAHPKGTTVLGNRAEPAVEALVRLARHTSCEEEKMRQFVRFEHLENGVWFAQCNPNASVIPLVMDYFAKRFNVQPFIIYDERHRIAGVYDGADWQLVDGEVVGQPERAADEAYFQHAWKRFYDALSIDARYNPELRRHFMPVRFWKNLTEMKPDISGQNSLAGK